MWCVPVLDQTYLERMEEVLQVPNRPLDERAPVVALDERPVQLLDSVRDGTPMAPGRPERRDYEYARRGTANVFCIVEPKRGQGIIPTPPKTALCPSLRERCNASPQVILMPAPFIW
jgi:hypothetical protein